MMDKDSSGQADASNTRGPVKIEWNWDLDDEWINLGDFRPGDEGRARLKGRCKRCWGGLIGRTDDEHLLTGIRCRVCDLLLEGDDAKDEYERMSKESGLNMLNMGWGHAPKYSDDATFVQKVFPHMDRQIREEFLQRVEEQASEGNKNGWLTRSDFPAGSAGFLFLQARVLMSGVERLPREVSVARFSDFDVNDDGSATIYLSEKELGQHSKTREYELMKRMGSTMTIAMMAAFTCELAMKAIRLTQKDEARKSHDLFRLYRDLPSDSRVRIEADFAEVKEVLRSGRHTFDKWRYFEANVGGRGMAAMIDTKRAFALAKAARVILDEAEMVGLGYSVNVDATQSVRKTGNQRDIHIKHHLKAKGTEAPPQ
ncbi:MAG: hypothetical protein OXH81_07005 [Gemmatimonadetes bacterium]|nr:hypothetical protein [Gemmatimonadota bacterium]